MISTQDISEITERLVRLYNPQAIYLFGSYAWGHPDEDSDLDFLIIVDKVEGRRHGSNYGEPLKIIF